MASSNFIDYVKIHCKSGKGGNGIVHFRREKHVIKGGPDGGDGGRGGHIILRGNAQLWTLLHLRYQKHIKANNGNNGSSARKTGADGDDVILDVPLGTIAKDAETGEQLMEITEDGQTLILLKGGRGGQGNVHFKSPTQQAPRYAQDGEDAIEQWIILELKVLADVGLVGFPNAGKSTLLSVVSAAKPEIADYAFTTLVPNLGVIAYRDDKSFVMADIPGIIEGAADGKGLGIRFLRHIERNAVLLFMISAELLDPDDIANNYDTLLHEVRSFNPEMLDKERVIAITKCDLIDPEDHQSISDKLPKDIPHVFISSVTQLNMMPLKDLLWSKIGKSHLERA